MQSFSHPCPQNKFVEQKKAFIYKAVQFSNSDVTDFLFFHKLRKTILVYYK